MDIIGILFVGLITLGGIYWAYNKIDEDDRRKKQQAVTLREQEQQAAKQEKEEKRNEEWAEQQHKLRTAESVNYLVELKIKNIRLEMEMISAQRELEGIRNPKVAIAQGTVDAEEKRRRQRERELKREMEDVEFEILKTAKTRGAIRKTIETMKQDELKNARDEEDAERIKDQYDALEDRLLNRVK